LKTYQSAIVIIGGNKLVCKQVVIVLICLGHQQLESDRAALGPVESNTGQFSSGNVLATGASVERFFVWTLIRLLVAANGGDSRPTKSGFLPNLDFVCSALDRLGLPKHTTSY
jgi:hypothetical protein